ncbi:MAG: TolC family protein, partial [Neisseriaceae bacterium]|nr:TolC family protein [Neisseriaceae bacterium]
MAIKNTLHLKKPVKTSLHVISLSLLLGACTLAPEYQKPQIQSNIPLPPPTLSADVQLRAHQIGWKNYFKDPQLKALIGIGLKNNYEVQKAMLNLKRANAQYGLDIYNLIPNFTFDGINKSRSGPIDNSSKQIITQQYSSGLGVTNFELDVYRKFDQGQAAGHQFKATYYDKLNSDITIISSIAKKYFAMRINETVLSNAKQSLEYQKELYRIQELRHKAGVIST